MLVPPPRLDQGEETGISGELAVADDTQTSAFRRHFAARRADEAAATTTLLEVCGIAKEYGGLVVLGALWSRGEPHLPGRAPHPRTDGARQHRSRLPRSQRSSLLRGIFISRLAQARAEAMEALEYLGLGELAHREVGSLTLETQRMVELARAMASRPTLLLLDEPASGLSEIQRERLREVLCAIGEVTCVLLVEHDLNLIAAIAERILVLESGALVFTGTGEEFRSSELVNSLLIGASPTTTPGGEQ